MSPRLTTIRTNGGAPFTVNADYADKFLGLLNDLEASGYPIEGDQSGGYNPRNIAGTSTPSQHAYGRAVDVNWTDNPRGKAGMIPADKARALATKYGMTWGGDWSNPDPMHFEIGGARPTAVAPVVHQGGAQEQGIQNVVAQVFSGLGGNPPQPAQPPQSQSGQFLYGLSPQGGGGQKADNPALAALNYQAPALPEMPNSMRRPVDLSRLREVLASRARLGTA